MPKTILRRMNRTRAAHSRPPVGSYSLTPRSANLRRVVLSVLSLLFSVLHNFEMVPRRGREWDAFRNQLVRLHLASLLMMIDDKGALARLVGTYKYITHKMLKDDLLNLYQH